MRKIFVRVGMSLDGFIAGPNRRPKNPLGDDGTAIHKWAFLQESFRRGLGLGSVGETGDDNRIIDETLKLPSTSHCRSTSAQNRTSFHVSVAAAVLSTSACVINPLRSTRTSASFDSR
jgi:hypothetical protein